MSYTKADKERIAKFRHIGCIISGSPEYDVHHIVDGVRLGNQYTIPLHPWYHRGVPFNGYSQAKMEKEFGPSLAKSKEQFIDKFGSEMELLKRVNGMLEQYK